MPYLIIPNTDEGHDPEKIVEYMVNHLKFNGKPLSKPNIVFRVRARGQSYLEWAEEVYNNDFLAQKWKWKVMLDADKNVIPTDKQYRPDITGRLQKVPMEDLVAGKGGGDEQSKANKVPIVTYPGPHTLEELCSQDDAMREFGDKLLAIFRDVVMGVVNSDGWFMFPGEFTSNVLLRQQVSSVRCCCRCRCCCSRAPASPCSAVARLLDLL